MKGSGLNPWHSCSGECQWFVLLRKEAEMLRTWVCQSIKELIPRFFADLTTVLLYLYLILKA